MAENDWRSSPILKGISAEKLDVLVKLLEESKSKSPKELIPFFIASTTDANNKGITFTDDETVLILSVLKTGMTEEDIKKIETIRKLSRMISKKKK